MARKPSKKQWKCKHGCELTHIPCSHLEELIAEKSDSKQVKLVYSANLEYLAARHTTQTYDDLFYSDTHELNKFKAFLKRYSLQEYQVNLLVDRFVYHKTLKQICKDQRWTSVTACCRSFVRALNTLTERGLSLSGLKTKARAPLK